MIYIHLRMEQPLCVTESQAQGAIRRSLLYIPGSALRGALAAQLRAAHPQIDDATFAETILDENARFHHFYPGPEARYLPHTARSCKHYPGFRNDKKLFDEAPHGVQDTLFAMARYQVEQQNSSQASPPHLRCSECGLPLEPYPHLYRGNQPAAYTRVEPDRRQIMQTAVDARRETARPANLFVVDTVVEKTEFAGLLRLGAGVDEEEFADKICPEGSRLHIGYGRTRGLGLAVVVNSAVSARPSWPPASLSERLDRLQERARQERLPPDRGYYFTLTLLSDAILLDPFLRPQHWLDGATLAREIDDPVLAQKATALLENRQPVFSASSGRTLSGWSSPHGLPTSDDFALTAGSTFLFAANGDNQDLPAVLAALENNGIGERRNEGFGQIVVCHPFHLERGTL
jgi:CRISPR-associated protein Csx10